MAPLTTLVSFSTRKCDWKPFRIVPRTLWWFQYCVLSCGECDECTLLALADTWDHATHDTKTPLRIFNEYKMHAVVEVLTKPLLLMDYIWLLACHFWIRFELSVWPKSSLEYQSRTADCCYHETRFAAYLSWIVCRKLLVPSLKRNHGLSAPAGRMWGKICLQSSDTCTIVCEHPMMSTSASAMFDGCKDLLCRFRKHCLLILVSQIPVFYFCYWVGTTLTTATIRRRRE